MLPVFRLSLTNCLLRSKRRCLEMRWWENALKAVIIMQKKKKRKNLVGILELQYVVKTGFTSFFCLVFFVRFQEFPGQHEPLRQLHRWRALQIRCVGHSRFLSEDLWFHVLGVVREPPPTNRQVNTQAG